MVEGGRKCRSRALDRLRFLKPLKHSRYNCDDRNCYKDLASLRGVKYFTWPPEKVCFVPVRSSCLLCSLNCGFQSHLIYPADDGRHPQTGDPHKKFTNYRFDPAELQRQVKLVSSASEREVGEFQAWSIVRLLLLFNASSFILANMKNDMQRRNTKKIGSNWLFAGSNRITKE